MSALPPYLSLTAEATTPVAQKARYLISGISPSINLISGIAINLISGYSAISYLISGFEVMADFKGGRGKKAGYETQMYRIPVPLKPTVEKLGLQFRLLWDGLTDPRGEKLISRIEAAIPDQQQLGNDSQENLISSLSDKKKPNIKFKELEDKLAEADIAIGELRSQLEEQKRVEQALRRGQKHLERELEEANQEIERLRTISQNRPAVDPSALALLQDAITPKSKGGSYAANNATGMKKLVEEVLRLLQSRPN